MKINKVLLLLMILSILGTALVYSSLPEEIPGHFNIRGEVDRYDNKISIFFTALLPLAIYILMLFLPKIDPKRNSYEKHKKAYDMTKIIMVLFLIVIHWVGIAYSLGFKFNVGSFVTIAVGIMFIVIGNFMTQVRQNYFFGIKTPWTLANETVWKKTHRVGGFSFLIGGIIILVSSFFSNGLVTSIALIAAIIIAVFYPVIYSYIEYRRICE